MDNMNHRPLVIMLAKPPLAGRVKTRLAVDGALSPAAAAGFYAACVADLTARLAGAPDYALVVCGPPGLDAAERQSLTDLLPAGVRLIEEPVSGRPPRDLGRIMEDVAFTCLGSETTRVALIGSDCALLTPDRVRAAFAALDEADLVLGPDGGGGCYLIGLRRRLPILTGPAALVGGGRKDGLWGASRARCVRDTAGGVPRTGLDRPGLGLAAAAAGVVSARRCDGAGWRPGWRVSG